MVVTTIYVTRHGFRGNWTVDPNTGQYFTNVPSPTGIASDPPLAAYGVRQAEQLATALCAIKSPLINHIYSSPFYRCLQTLQPFVEKSSLEVKGDNGLGEWYGLARFSHPSPATTALLHGLFPSYNLDYKPSIIPSSSGETIAQLHDRCAYALQYLIAHADTEDVARINQTRERGQVEGVSSGEQTAILICTHAASLIAIGRVLTGKMPEDICEEDFKTYTCGISKFVRRVVPVSEQRFEQVKAGEQIPKINWKGGRGVAGGWDCEINGNCRHLDGGEERGWGFKDAETIQNGLFSDVSNRLFQGDEVFELGEKGTSAKL